MLLPLNEQRVQDAAAVVDRDVTEEPDITVTGSTSTTATCAPNGNVDPRWRKRPSARSAPRRSRPATLGPPDASIGRARRPRTPPRPVPRSAASTSSSAAATSRPFSTTASACSKTDEPPICSEREPHVPSPRATRPVSECTTVTSSNGIPASRKRAARTRSRARARRASFRRTRSRARRRPSRPPRTPGLRTRDLHVGRDPDAETASSPRARRSLLGTQLLVAGQAKRLVEASS